MAGTNFPAGPAMGLYVSDDFFSNEAVADAAVGSLRWEIVAIGNGSTAAYLATTNAGVGHYGVLRLTTAVTANGDGVVLRFAPDSVVLGPDGGFIRFMARIPAITGNVLAGNNLRIGLMDSETATSPTVGIWVDVDGGVVSLQADSADHGDVAAAAAAQNMGGNSLTSGTTLVLGTWHEFFLEWSGENDQGGPESATLTVDSHLVAEVHNIMIDDDEEMELSIVAWQDSGAGDTLEVDIDWIELFIARG